MDSTGIFRSITRNLENGKIQLTFEFEQDISNCVDDIKDGLLTITVKKFRKKRSRDANAYYWKLLTELAGKLNISKSVLHNRLLRDYGQPEIIDGKLVYLVLPDSDSCAKIADSAETYHIKPTTQIKVGTDGISYRTYMMLRGSSTYNTLEMSHLINGLVSDCQEQGIATIPPDEFDRMMEIYDRQWKKKHGGAG